MNNTIRFLTRLIAATCVLFLTQCREDSPYKVGIAQCSSDDWREKMNDEIRMEAMLHDNVEVEIRSAYDSSAKQIADLEYFVDNGFDIIVVAPNEAESLTPVIADIYKKNIPVVIFDRKINGDTYTQHIGVDNTGMGKSAAHYAMNLVKDSMLVMEVYGLPGSTPAEERSRGFSHALSDLKGRVVASAPGNWNQDNAEYVVDSMLHAFPETNLIFAHNDRMAIGASEVARSHGRHDIKIIGIDAAPTLGLKAVADGKIDATFLYPTEGDLVLREALKILKGEPFQREIMLPLSSAVDSTNADILLLQNAVLEEDAQKVKVLKGQLDDFLSRQTEQKALFSAIIVILVLLFGVLFLVLRTFWQHRRHQEALLKKTKLLQEERDKQKELNERLEAATQSKIAFFTNVSHDLRTPLTLIAEPVAQLNGAPNLNESQQILIKIADKNVKILQRLINHILDFQKYEDNRLELHLTEIDFGKVISDWLESFHTLARKRDIRLLLEKPEDEVVQLAIDVEKIESVFFNLISNALKYSPDNSKVTVSYYIKENKLIIKVADTGFGISKEDIGHIFERFFRVEHLRPKGSGIGLALAKAFVDLHGGEMEVESELKKGTTFTVILPVMHVSDTATDVVKTITEEDVNGEFIEVESEVQFKENKPLLLVIDDNKDIREMVTELMKDDYNVITSSSGKDGLKKAVKYVPDLIICDVMMPGIDGMETCNKLKYEQTTSHIPVLMLTACALDEQKVQGFESGADGYLAKPFSSAVLKAHVASLIDNRKRIKNVWGKTIPANLDDAEQKSVKIKAGELDNDFYNRFIDIFNRDISNPDLNVENIASAMGLERTQFYRKIKAITNYSPVELMRNLRLKKARKLLKGSEKTISEICYEVGFSTPAYFTKCYREAYGETPSETRSNLV